MALVGLGSGYYHLQPANETLVWDRLPMTVAFMAMFAALVGEYTVERAGRSLLFPALIAGVLSVLHWYHYDDLRIYGWVQFFPLLSIPLLMVLFRARYSHSLLLLPALGAYVAAKVLETFDHQVFALTGRMVSGHTLKHVFAAVGCLLVLEMLRRRKGVEAGEA